MCRLRHPLVHPFSSNLICHAAIRLSIHFHPIVAFRVSLHRPSDRAAKPTRGGRTAQLHPRPVDPSAARPLPTRAAHSWTSSRSTLWRLTWWAPSGIAAIPTTALDPPHSAASPAVPALIGSGSPSTAVANRLHGQAKLPTTSWSSSSPRFSGTQRGSPARAGRGSGRPGHCRAAWRGSHWRAQNAGGQSHRTVRRS
jgi:hypothetical protein